MSQPPDSSSSDETDSGKTTRQRIADLLPFFLRAWYLRNYEQGDPLTQAEGFRFTTSSVNHYSDPLCDITSSDFPL